jgi:hypothetical protein
MLVNAFINIKRRFFNDFNVEKNVAFNYLKKLPSSKISSKRYLNQDNNKIVEFPRKGSF